MGEGKLIKELFCELYILFVSCNHLQKVTWSTSNYNERWENLRGSLLGALLTLFQSLV
jgi:hypothetical protein